METQVDMDDLTPSGASFRTTMRPDASAAPVATFTRPPDLSLDEIWHGGRTTDLTRDGVQGQPGHEPADTDERDSGHTVQNVAAAHVQVAGQIRGLLRPGGF